MPKLPKTPAPEGPKPTKSGMIRARVNPELQASTERVLSQLGLSPSDAIRLFYSQITLRNGLPFEVKLPNAASQRALREIAEGKLKRYESVEAMRKDLGF